MEKPDSSSLVFRVDLLTGCNNLVSFNKALSDNFTNTSFAHLSLIAIDICNFGEINQLKGRAFGDSLLRWLGFAIKDTTGVEAYRVSGDDFVAVLIGENHVSHAEKARELFERLNRNAEPLDLQPPIARITAFHFPKGQILDIATVWKYLNEKHNYIDSDHPFHIVEVDPSFKMSYDTAQALVLMANRITDLGFMLENTFGLAYTDPISGSPNMLATQHKLDLALAEASQQHKPLSICLLDGDDLRRYNSMDYAAGDDVIRKLNTVLTSSLRPNDFLGRWRMGDEFILILPDTNSAEAQIVGERLRAAVEDSSKIWLYPTTISIGIASHPQNGNLATDLLEHAEQALKSAKMMGKNKVIVADQ